MFPVIAQPPPTALSGVEVVAPGSLSEVIVEGRLRCALPPAEGEKAVPPRVVDSYPRPGAVAPPGLTYLWVTFSRRMSPCGFLLASSFLGGAYPEFLEEPARLTRDLKTFYFAVRTEPGRRYTVQFNAPLTRPYFRALRGGAGAAPFALTFRMGEGPAVTSPREALANDPAGAGLADLSGLLKLWVPRGDDRDDDADLPGPDEIAGVEVCGRCVGAALGGQEPPPQQGDAAASPAPP